MDEPKIPNTARFWRLNDIEALKGMGNSCDPPQDPEEWQRNKEIRAELAGLQAREKAVKARYNRILNRPKAEP